MSAANGSAVIIVVSIDVVADPEAVGSNFDFVWDFVQFLRIIFVYVYFV